MQEKIVINGVEYVAVKPKKEKSKFCSRCKTGERYKTSSYCHECAKAYYREYSKRPEIKALRAYYNHERNQLVKKLLQEHQHRKEQSQHNYFLKNSK